MARQVVIEVELVQRLPEASISNIGPTLSTATKEAPISVYPPLPSSLSDRIDRSLDRYADVWTELGKY